jgi:hypothetical protein
LRNPLRSKKSGASNETEVASIEASSLLREILSVAVLRKKAEHRRRIYPKPCAEAIRDLIGIRKRRHMTAEALSSLGRAREGY